jgi:hypothetical protein
MWTDSKILQFFVIIIEFLQQEQWTFSLKYLVFNIVDSLFFIIQSDILEQCTRAAQNTWTHCFRPAGHGLSRERSAF